MPESRCWCCCTATAPTKQDLLSLADLLPAGLCGRLGARSDGVWAPGFTWFPLTASIDYSLDAVKDAASYVEDWLDSVRPDHQSVTLLGFSMGMAWPPPCCGGARRTIAAVVGLSGFAVDADGDPTFRDAELDGTVPCSGAATSRTR